MTFATPEVPLWKTNPVWKQGWRKDESNTRTRPPATSHLLLFWPPACRAGVWQAEGWPQIETFGQVCIQSSLFCPTDFQVQKTTVWFTHSSMEGTAGQEWRDVKEVRGLGFWNHFSCQDIFLSQEMESMFSCHQKKGFIPRCISSGDRAEEL